MENYIILSDLYDNEFKIIGFDKENLRNNFLNDFKYKNLKSDSWKICNIEKLTEWKKDKAQETIDNILENLKNSKSNFRTLSDYHNFCKQYPKMKRKTDNEILKAIENDKIRALNANVKHLHYLTKLFTI